MLDFVHIIIDGCITKYTVDVSGRIYSGYTKKFLNPYFNKRGYLMVDLHHNGNRYTRQVHRIVAQALIPNPEHLETVNHKNGDKTDNSVSNLEWMTVLDNVRHAWRTGLAKPRYGEENPANVYPEHLIHTVCQMIEDGSYSNKAIAEKCGVNVTLIRDIKFRGKWKQISSLYNISNIPKYYEHTKHREFIDQCISNGMSNLEILNELNPLDDKRHAFHRYIQRRRDIYNQNRRALNDYPSDGSTLAS